MSKTPFILEKDVTDYLALKGIVEGRAEKVAEVSLHTADEAEVEANFVSFKFDVPNKEVRATFQYKADGDVPSLHVLVFPLDFLYMTKAELKMSLKTKASSIRKIKDS